jgi:hypothetical protein
MVREETSPSHRMGVQQQWLNPDGGDPLVVTLGCAVGGPIIGRDMASHLQGCKNI